ncbi:hypothetical protein Salat_1709500 [Sesamum alatum]|uniref:Uncharacterized protein n=1 Tax=Sesamum alatum TaxID=300844 RepID=A0AAE1Y7K1_9LAMI|nr:hypothetical protein Salat_1709500 [Sesamum alatum]
MVVEGILGQLKRGLNLTGDEDAGMVMADEVWHKDSGNYQLCLVGRVLTNRAYNFEGMGRSVKDKNCALAGCPWSFVRNLLILNRISINANPMYVDLNWSKFHVQIHGVPLSRMNLEIATLIGNRLGKFRELELDELGWPSM